VRSSLADLMCSFAPIFTMTSRPPVDWEHVHSGASALADSRRFIALGLCVCRSTAATAPSIGATPSINANSTSVAAAAYWGTTSPHPVDNGRIPSPIAGARIPSPAAGAWIPSTIDAADVHGSSFVDLLRR
jgi:hypothetical protein